VSPITESAPESRDFQNDLPLHPAARELLHYFFDSAWPDPTKIHHRSSTLRNHLNSAREVIAGHLGLQLDELEIVGELGFGFEVALAGLLKDPSSHLYIGEIDRQVVHAFARLHTHRGGAVTLLRPNSNGMISYDVTEVHQKSTMSWQATNREVGMIQELPPPKDGRAIFADMTASFPIHRLPESWDSAVWDPRTFGGPQGIALIGIAREGSWRNPGPEVDKRRVYGSFSKPLLLATAVAVENWAKSSQEEMEKLEKLHQLLSSELQKRISSVHVVLPPKRDPRYLAFVIDNVIAEEVLRNVELEGFLIDAGSACGAGALSPSHVLTSMGYKPDGNFRITLKPHHSEADCVALVDTLVKGVAAST
jgi:cysteine desulfurase